jgi:hypothetical protein
MKDRYSMQQENAVPSVNSKTASQPSSGFNNVKFQAALDSHTHFYRNARQGKDGSM